MTATASKHEVDGDIAGDATMSDVAAAQPRARDDGQATLPADVVLAAIGQPTLDMDEHAASTGYPTEQADDLSLTGGERPGAAGDSDGDSGHTSDATLDAINVKPTQVHKDADQPTRPEDGLSLDEKIRAHLDSGPRKEKKDPLLGERLGGRFLVLKKIGAGGMGAVYRARQEGMDRDVAVKVLLGDLAENETVLRRFTLEALAVSRLRHPNTIQIFDYGQTPQGNPYIAMELLEGQTLHDLLRKERPLPIRRALRIMSQVAASLAEAHEKGIVHRDLKPENIFLVPVSDNPDYVKVLDFGVAKLRDKDEKGTLTQAGSIFGTPRYMSPEQCSAQPVDGRSDLYALGVMLYEMITGEAPFSSDQPLVLLLAHVNDPPPPPSGVSDKQVIPAEVEEFVLKLLAKAPEDRMQEATALSRLCHDLAETLPAAFDARVGSEEAESLGVRLPSASTMQFPTARTMRVGEQPTIGVAGLPPDLALPRKSETGTRKLVVPMAVVGLVGVAALVYALSVGRAQAPVVVEKQVFVDRQATTQLPADMVELTVVSSPAGAFVNLGTENIGVTPLTLQRKLNAPAEQWALMRDGYEGQAVDVTFAASHQVSVVLKRLPVAGQVAPGAGPADEDKPAVRPRPKGEGGDKSGRGEARVDAKPPELKAVPKIEAKPEVKPEAKAVEHKPEPERKPKPPEQVDDLK